MNQILKTKLNTIEDCEIFVKEMSYVLYFLASLIFLAVIFFKNIGNLIDVYMLILFGWSIKKYKSRAVSILIFVYSLLTCYVNFYNHINHLGGGQNIFLAIMFLFYSAVLIRATFLYYKLNNFKTNYKNFFIKLVIALANIVVSFLAYSIFFYLFLRNFDNLRDGAIISIMFITSIFLAFIGFFPFGKKILIIEKTVTIQNLNIDEKSEIMEESFLNKGIYQR